MRSSKMTPAKKHIIDIVKQQPDDSTYDKILRELALARMIEKGLQDSNSGRLIDNAEMGRRICSGRE